MYREQRIAAVIPAYNESLHIADVIAALPEFVDAVIVVDDGSTDSTAAVVAAVAAHEPRVTLIRHTQNGGVGAARVSGITRALAGGGYDIIVNLDGDDQMDTSLLSALLDPIVDGVAEFTKGNRFFSLSSFEGMPTERVLGNIITTFATKLATGYWSIFDPQNGFTAVRTDIATRLNLDTIATDYSFENDMLGRLALLRARVRDIDIPARYGDESSSINPAKVVPSIIRMLWRTFWQRLWLTYVVRSFSPVAMFVLAGVPLLVFSLAFGTWAVVDALGPGEVSAANAAFTSLTFTVGLILLIAAMVIDVINEPR